MTDHEKPLPPETPDEAAARRLRMRERNDSLIFLLILASVLPFVASAYSSLWSLAWEIIP